MRRTRHGIGISGLLLALLLLVTTCPLRAQAPAPADPSPETSATAPDEGLTGTLTVHVIDVGQGDAILVRAPSGRTLLVDAGDDAEDAGPAIVEYLARLGIRRVDTFLLTHPHDDHYGGLFHVLGRVAFGEFLYGTRVTTSKYKKMEARVLELGIPYRHIGAGAVLDLGGGTKARVLAGGEDQTLEVLTTAPTGGTDDERGDDLNACSIVLRVTHGSASFLLTGDATKSVEDRLVASGAAVASTVYKAAHHGSRYSNTAAFLAAVAPTHGVITCGRNNQFGHPHAPALARIEAACSQVFRTDTQGSIRFSTNGSGIAVDHGFAFFTDLLRDAARGRLFEILTVPGRY